MEPGSYKHMKWFMNEPPPLIPLRGQAEQASGADSGLLAARDGSSQGDDV